MSRLTVYTEDDAQVVLDTVEPDIIAESLAGIGLRFERWQAAVPLSADAPAEAILAAYAEPIRQLCAEGGYVATDVVRMVPEHPERAAMREKFLDEHVHGEDEVRFFVEGSGAFYIHKADHVHRVVCERGDLLRVPADTLHWFDMGPRPSFAAIRLFNNPAGWVARFSGDPIARRFPRYGE